MRRAGARWVSIIRWAARLVAVVLAAFLIMFIVGEGFIAGGGPPPLRVLAPFLMLLAGFGLAWRFEGLGSLLILAVFIYFNVMEWRANGRLLRVGAFHLLLIPAVLFLIAWCAQRHQRESIAPMAGR
jgi:hypothetical protein